MTPEQINEQLDLGLKHLQSGNLSQAKICFEQILQFQPYNGNAWHLLGLVAWQEKDYQTATERMGGTGFQPVTG